MATGKRTVILDAALSIINEKGLKALTLPALFERAHTGAGTFYHYFKDVADLIDQVYARCLEVSSEIILAPDDKNLPAHERFDTAIANLFKAYRTYPRELDFIHQYSYGYVTPAANESTDMPALILITEIIECAQKEGMAPDSLPPRPAARIVRSMVSSAFWAYSHGEFELTEEDERHFAEMAWRFVCSPEEGPAV